MLLAHAHDSPARKFSTLRGSSTVGQVFWVARKPAGCSTPCSASARGRRQGTLRLAMKPTTGSGPHTVTGASI